MLSLLRHSYSPHQILKTRVLALSVEDRVDRKPKHELRLIFEAPIEPCKLLIFFAEGEIDKRDRCWRHIGRLAQLFQFLKRFSSFACLSGLGVAHSQARLAEGAIRIPSESFFVFVDGLGILRPNAVAHACGHVGNPKVGKHLHRLV